MVDAKLAMELRQRTGAGIMDAKAALEEAGSDLEKAIEILRKRGAVKAAKKGVRTTAEGVVACYIHHTHKLGALVEVQCETDFVARNQEFQDLGNELAMQVAAMDPTYVSPETIPASELEAQRQIFVAESAAENKPAEVQEKMVEGKLKKWQAEVCLTKQSFFKNEDQTVEGLLEENISKIGENIRIARFVRFQM